MISRYLTVVLVEFDIDLVQEFIFLKYTLWPKLVSSFSNAVSVSSSILMASSYIADSLRHF